MKNKYKKFLKVIKMALLLFVSIIALGAITYAITEFLPCGELIILAVEALVAAYIWVRVTER